MGEGTRNIWFGIKNLNRALSELGSLGKGPETSIGCMCFFLGSTENTGKRVGKGDGEGKAVSKGSVIQPLPLRVTGLNLQRDCGKRCRADSSVIPPSSKGSEAFVCQLPSIIDRGLCAGVYPRLQRELPDSEMRHWSWEGSMGIRTLSSDI